MRYQIRLKNNKEFEADESSSILKAALDVGFHLPHSCLRANCSSCKVKVLEGRTESLQPDSVLTNDERAQNYILSCNTRACTDLLLDAEDLSEYNLAPSKVHPAKINSIDYAAPDIIRLRIRVPPTSKIQFSAGQYVDLIKEGIRRSYSISNSPIDGSSELEFYIRQYPNGVMSNYLFNQAKVNDLLQIEGPKGTFFLRENHKKHIVFLATGTGIAPVKAIIDDLSTKESGKLYKSRLSVIWGNRDEKDIFLNDKAFENKLNVEFIKVISRPSTNWKGLKGYVQDVVLNSGYSLSEMQVYACGSNVMIKSAKNLLTKNGLQAADFFSDAFVQSN
jgi:CDP-4-dehydro-6-deoxyglucose reductase